MHVYVHNPLEIQLQSISEDTEMLNAICNPSVEDHCSQKAHVKDTSYKLKTKSGHNVTESSILFSSVYTVEERCTTVTPAKMCMCVMDNCNF